MLDRRQTRPGLNRGRYLFFSLPLRALIGSIDLVSSWFSVRPLQRCDADPTSILVSTQAHIGDVILATSALPVLRAAFPNARIGFLTHPSSRVVLDDHPMVDRVHVFTHWKLDRRPVGLLQKLWQSWMDRSRVVQELKAARYDLAIDLYAYFPNSTLIHAASRIPIRVGWTSGGFGAWLTHALEWQESGRHVVAWHRKLLGVLSACRPHLDLASPLLHSTAAALATWSDIASKDLAGMPYVVCHVGAGASRKRWLDRAWHELLDALASRGIRVVLLGHGLDDQRLSASLHASTPTSLDLVGTLDWQTMSVAMAGARLVIGLESMSSHVAATWQVPTVCIAPALTGPEWHPMGPVVRVITAPTPCAPCYVPNGCPGMDCIRNVRAGDVLKQVDDLMNLPMSRSGTTIARRCC
jgi:heptosyltransferase-2